MILNGPGISYTEPDIGSEFVPPLPEHPREAIVKLCEHCTNRLLHRDELLATISETLDFEAEVATKRLVTLLEPIMIVIMGLIVAFVVVAVILPIYQSYGTIGQSSSTY